MGQEPEVATEQAARDETGVDAARVAFAQAVTFVAFYALPAAAASFLTLGLEAETQRGLAYAYLYVVAPLGFVSVAVIAAMAASLGRAVSRVTPAASGEDFEPPAARRLRAFPAVAALVAFLSGVAAAAICAAAVFNPGARPAWTAILFMGVAAALVYGLVSYVAAENYLTPIFGYLTAKKVRFARRGAMPFGARSAVAGGLGAAALIALVTVGPYFGPPAASALGKWLAAAALAAVAAAAAYVAARRVTAPLRSAGTSSPVTYYVGDELEELTAACRRFSDETRGFDEKIRRVAEELSAEAARVRQSLTEQASITSQQASAISQTSVTMKELAGTVKQTAARAEEISGRVDSSAGLVRTARDQIMINAEGIEALADEAETAAKLAVVLNQRARRMDEIVTLVNDLAEQSTVLALNAAIEAAKAGEFGRGFSAVAREVKNLAGSSKEGTEEIRKILHDIRDGTVKTVTSARGSAEQSNVLREGAARAKNMVEEIVPLVDEIGRTSKQIAASARQQSLGLEQVTTAVENINEAAAEALTQVKAVRDAVDNIAHISSRLADETDAAGWSKRR
jgi:methyl-accepting chemotaxis protein